MTDLPSGPYTGTVHGPFRFLNRIWQGKVFTGATVLNLLIQGQVSQDGETVIIRYPWLGVTDSLMPRADGSYDGTVAFLGVRLPLRFMLVRRMK